MAVVSPFADKVNAFLGIVVAFLSYILGEHWALFAFFLFCNLMDFITRWIAARITGTESSHKGWTGILKKIGYWLMIMLSFGMSVIFVSLGKTIGVDLGITDLLGWFVLATLTINEVRSILENFVDAGYKVPWFLVKGLEVANKALDGESPFEKEHEDEK